ncbi:MAG: restriction endonuclease subunit S [Kiritimatiellae bacterium]|nr:restriction endonuclease subunit S [Kiritimatiellia bacterium]
MAILKGLVMEHSERNRTGALCNVHSVTNSRGFVPSTDYFNKEVFSSDLKNYKVVHKGMLAYNPSRINVGSVSLLDSADAVVVSPLYVVVEVVKGSLLPEYLNAFLHSPAALAQIKGLTSGGVRDYLRYSAFELLQLPVPNIKEQRSIVEKLACVKDIINKRKVQKNLLSQLVKSRFVEMFGDPITNPKRWPMERLGDRCLITTGNTPSRSGKENYGKFIEWIKSDNLVDGRLTTASEYLSEIGYGKSRHVGAGSILMTCIAGSLNSIGNCALVDREVTFNQQLNAITPYKDDVVFLLWLLRLAKPVLHKGINKCLKGILSKSNLSGKVLPIPPLTLQREFAAFVVKVDKLAFAARQRRDVAKQLYRAKIQEFFG